MQIMLPYVSLTEWVAFQWKEVLKYFTTGGFVKYRYKHQQ